MIKKKLLLILGMLVLALSLTACSTGEIESEVDQLEDKVEDKVDQVEEKVDQAEDKVEEKVDQVEDKLDGAEEISIKISPEEVFDIFMDKYPNAKVEKLQIDKDMGAYVYEVEGFGDNKEYEVKISSTNGEIIKEHEETDVDMDNKEITRDHVAKVMPLVDKAMAEAGEDAVLEEWTLEMDDGIVELEIEIDRKGLDDRELTYNVETGELVDIDD